MKNFIKIILIIVSIILFCVLSTEDLKNSKASNNIDNINKVQYNIQQSEIQLSKEVK